MNSIEKNLKLAIAEAVEKAFEITMSLDEIVIEIPKDTTHGDYSTNTAMRLTKRVGKKPRDVAQILCDTINKEAASIDRIDIAGPGFVNFFMKSDSLANII